MKLIEDWTGLILTPEVYNLCKKAWRLRMLGARGHGF